MNKLLIFKEDFQDKEGTYSWHGIHPIGQLELDNHTDFVMFNQPSPAKVGYYIASTLDNQEVTIRIARINKENGYLYGRCCYTQDKKALNHINTVY